MTKNKAVKSDRGPWLPQVEDKGGQSGRRLQALCQRWGYGGRPLKIAQAIRKAIDEAYEREAALAPFEEAPARKRGPA
jgi:hypothetical protein